MKPSEYVRKGWCQVVSSRDTDGRPCNPDDPNAAQWCLVGAVKAAYPEDTKHRYNVCTKLQTALGKLQFARWNDNLNRTQAEVIALLESIGE